MCLVQVAAEDPITPITSLAALGPLLGGAGRCAAPAEASHPRQVSGSCGSLPHGVCCHRSYSGSGCPAQSLLKCSVPGFWLGFLQPFDVFFWTWTCIFRTDPKLSMAQEYLFEEMVKNQVARWPNPPSRGGDSDRWFLGN